MKGVRVQECTEQVSAGEDESRTEVALVSEKEAVHHIQRR